MAACFLNFKPTNMTNEEMVARIAELEKVNNELAGKLDKYQCYGTPEHFGTEVQRLKDELAEYDYSYDDAVYEDVCNKIDDLIEHDELPHLDKDGVREWLNDKLWTDDSVTGNGSGSYTFNAYLAEKYICHNLGYITEKLTELGNEMFNERLMDPEAIDVAMRCALLPIVIDEAIENHIHPDFWLQQDEDEED